MSIFNSLLLNIWIWLDMIYSYLYAIPAKTLRGGWSRFSSIEFSLCQNKNWPAVLKADPIELAHCHFARNLFGFLKASQTSENCAAYLQWEFVSFLSYLNAWNSYFTFTFSSFITGTWFLSKEGGVHLQSIVFCFVCEFGKHWSSVVSGFILGRFLFITVAIENTLNTITLWKVFGSQEWGTMVAGVQSCLQLLLGMPKDFSR